MKDDGPVWMGDLVIPVINGLFDPEGWQDEPEERKRLREDHRNRNPRSWDSHPLDDEWWE